MQRGYNMDAIQDGPTVTYGDSHTTDPVKHTASMNGHLDAFVVEDLGESLISVRDYTRNGNEVIFTSGGGIIKNPFSKNEIKIHLVNDQYYVDLNDVDNIPMANMLCSKSSTIKDFNASMTINQRIKDLHERMGHVHPNVMAIAVSGEDPAWTNTGLTSEQITKYYAIPENRCLCYLVSANRPKKKVRLSEKSVMPGEVISADPIFKIYPESYDKDLGAFLFADEATGYLHVFVGRSKSQFFECLKIVVLWYRSWSCTVKFLQTDAEAVVMSKELTDWCLENGIHTRQSIPYEHWQNFVERDIQSFNKGVAVLMNDQEYLAAKYWPFAAFHWVDVHNRTPNLSSGSQSPWQRITKSKFNLMNQFQFKFGEPVCVPVVQPEKNWRFDMKNDIAIFIGQPIGSVHGGRVFYPWSGKVLVRGSLSKITALKQDIKRWIGVRQELMNGTLSQGQMLSKLMEELVDVKDVIEELSQATSSDEQGDQLKDDGTTHHVVEEFTDTPISKVRRNPI